MRRLLGNYAGVILTAFIELESVIRARGGIVLDEQVHFSKLAGYEPLESCYHLIVHCDVVAAPKRLRRNGEQSSASQSGDRN